MRPAVRRIVIGLLAGAVLGGLLLGATILKRHGPSGRKITSGRVQRVRTPVYSVGDLALFSGRAEGLPASVERVLRTPTKEMRWKDAQRLPMSAPARLWAVPGNGVLCFVTQQEPESVGTICSTQRRAQKHDLYTSYLSNQATHSTRVERVIIGIAPDGTRDAVAYTHGVPVRIPVIDGVFLRRDEQRDAPGKVALLPEP